MGHKIDLVFVKKFLIDDPWSIRNDLIHPPDRTDGKGKKNNHVILSATIMIHISEE